MKYFLKYIGNTFSTAEFYSRVPEIFTVIISSWSTVYREGTPIYCNCIRFSENKVLLVLEKKKISMLQNECLCSQKYLFKWSLILLRINPLNFNQCKLLINISCHYGIKIWWLQQRWKKVKTALVQSIDTKPNIRGLKDILLFYSKFYISLHDYFYRLKSCMHTKSNLKPFTPGVKLSNRQS